MSLREKRTWVAFWAMVVFGLFYVPIGLDLFFGLASGEMARFFFFAPAPIPWFFVLVIALAALAAAAHVSILLRTPRSARMPADELERLIANKSLRPAYFMMMAGALVLILVMHTRWGMVTKAYCVLLVIWLAQLLRYGMQLVYFRRGV